MIPERLTSGITSSRAGLALAARYANRRKAFGQTIRNYQGVNFKIADCVTKLDAVTAFAHTVAKIVQEELGTSGYRRRLVSEVKKFSTTTQWDVLNDCMQILGGIGYTNALPIERELRGSRLSTIWTGTTEIQNMIIQHEYFKELLSKGIEWWRGPLGLWILWLAVTVFYAIPALWPPPKKPRGKKAKHTPKPHPAEPWTADQGLRRGAPLLVDPPLGAAGLLRVGPCLGKTAVGPDWERLLSRERPGTVHDQLRTAAGLQHRGDLAGLGDVQGALDETEGIGRTAEPVGQVEGQRAMQQVDLGNNKTGQTDGIAGMEGRGR